MLDSKRSAAACAPGAWILLLLACAQPRESRRSEPEKPPVLDGTEWIVTSLNGLRPITGSNITLSFEGGTISGYGGCNWYGSSYSASDTTLQFGGAESTQRKCEMPAGVMLQETKYHETLREVTTVHMAGDQLAMANRAGETLLLLAPRTRAAMNPDDLIGTFWQLRSIDDTIETRAPLTLSLTADQIGGFAGCRGYTGTYRARGDEIRILSLGMTATDCGRGDSALLREGRFTTDLSEASHYVLGGDSLVIVTAPGRRLVFTPLAAARHAAQVTGEWEKEEQTLPPIHLRLWVERDTLRARLRLSGSESFGIASFDGRALRLDLSGRARPLEAELVAPNELELRLGARGYRLRRRQ
jgi:heat shock protein HslJ